MTDNIEVHATDEHGRHIVRHIVGDPPTTDHTVIATAELAALRAELEQLRLTARVNYGLYRSAHEDAEQAEAAIERVRRFSELVINGSIRVQAIHQARDTLTVLNGDELKDPVIEAERDEAEQRIDRLTDQLVAEREKRRGAETAITRARALHRDAHGEGICTECSGYYSVTWPCDTARALDLPATTTGGQP